MQWGRMCVPPHVPPPVLVKLSLTSLSLSPCNWGFPLPHPLESSMKPILTWIRELHLLYFYSSIYPTGTFIHRLFVLEGLLHDWCLTDESKCPHSGFISTVCPSRPLCLQFCAGAVPVGQSPAGDACQHRGKWRRRGEYLNYILGGDWDTP